MLEQKIYLESLPLEAYRSFCIPIFIKNNRSQYLWANDFFIKKSAGLPSIHEIYKKEDHEFAWTDYADELKANDKLLLQSEQTLSVPERILRHDGTYVDIISKKCPLLDKHHRVIGLIGFSMELPKPSCLSSLSKREQSVVLLLSEGLTDKQIAKKWNISPRTVESHVINAKRKMNVMTRAELIAKISRTYP